MKTRLYRFTGALTGLLAGALVALFFMATATMAFGNIVAPWRPLFFIMAAPMVLLGYVFDSLPVRRRLAQIATPGYITSSIYWFLAFPFVKLTNDLLLAFYFPLFTGARFIWPPYLTRLGFDGIIGFFVYQALIGIAFGAGFYMVYEKVFLVFEKVDKRSITNARGR
ncbi:MAG: hypothetical protein ACM3TT_01165 [Syntrophothermus sp.]